MKQKYINGDIVCINGCIRIIEQSDGYYTTFYDENDELQEVNANLIKGIPLTPEVLEKNGWKKCSYGYWTNGDIYIQEDRNKAFYFCMDNNEYSIPYAHSLQHLLFGLGLNSEMEVWV